MTSVSLSFAAWLAADVDLEQHHASEENLLAVLKSKASAAEKADACRALREVGTEKSVPALAALLTN